MKYQIRVHRIKHIRRRSGPIRVEVARSPTEIRGGDGAGSDSKAKEIAEDAGVLREGFQSLKQTPLRLLSARLPGPLLRHRFLFDLGFSAANQRQGIRRVEGELANRGLPRRAQSNVNAAIARHSDRYNVPENPLPLFRTQVRVIVDLSRHLLSGQVVVLAIRLDIDVGFGHALLDQEALDAVNSTLGERLVIFNGAAMIRVASENQVRIRFASKVLFEVGRQRDQRLLLTR